MNLREKKEKRTRQDILDAALSLFCSEGIEAARLADIAERAEVGERTIYRYFSGKEELVRALYIDNLEAMRARMRDVPMPPQRDRASMIGFLDGFVRSLALGVEGMPLCLVFDLLFNVYAATRGQDPTTFVDHPSRTASADSADHEAGGRRVAPEWEPASMLLGYAQRVCLFELQSEAPDWEAAAGRVVAMGRLVREGLRAGGGEAEPAE